MDKLNFRAVIPMGAIREDDKLDSYIDDPNYIAEVKYDGYRMLGWFEHDRIRFTTRSIAIDSARAGNPMPTERTDNAPHLRDLKHNHYGTILDGEFYKPGKRSHDITSAIGGLPETSIANQERDGYVRYVVYDILQHDGADVTGLPYEERRGIIEVVVSVLQQMNPVVKYKDLTINNMIHTSEVIPHELKRERYEQIVSSGGEGIVLKHKDSKYHLGTIRNGKGVPSKLKANKKKGISHTPWVKWKKYSEFDCVIMGFSPATEIYTGNDVETWTYWEDELGNKFIASGREDAKNKTEYSEFEVGIRPITKLHYYNWPGAIIFGQYNDKGELIEVGNTSGITDEMRAEFASDPNMYIGRVITVGAMERIKKTQALREPRFLYIRPIWDKPAKECTMDE